MTRDGKHEKKFVKQNNPAYRWSVKLLPKKYHQDLHALYVFLHTTQEFVDNTPPNKRALNQIESGYKKALEDTSFEQISHSWDEPGERALKHIVRLTHKYKFDPSWVEAYLAAKQQELANKGFANTDEALRYVYGTAETVALMVCRILDLPEEAHEPAKLHARAMQWIDFVRSIGDDAKRDRLYFPRNDLRTYNLPDLSAQTAQNHTKDFERFVRFQLKQASKWHKQAKTKQAKLTHIPHAIEGALRAGKAIYSSIAGRIERQPLCVHNAKVRPRRVRLVWEGSKQAMHKTARVIASHETAIGKH